MQLSERSFEVVAETGLNLVMKWGFGHDVEMCNSGFVIIFNPSDLQMVEFQQLSVQLLKKIVYVARLPLKCNDRLGAALARVDDVVDNLVNRGDL